MELKDLENLFSLLKGNDITDFELEQDGTKIKLQRAGRQVVSSVGTSPEIFSPVVNSPLYPGSPISSNGAANGNGSQGNALANAGLVEVKSPIVGTFYRKPSPDAELFVQEGDVVKKGDTLCIIEAMKLMNEIEAPQGGKISKVLLTDGKVVEYGEVLFLIEPSA